MCSERSARTASVPASLASRFIRDCACLALLALALKRSMNDCRCARSSLFLLVRDLLLAQVLGALAFEIGVVADVQLGLALVQVQGVGADVVEELAVVRDHQQVPG
jgi:hypothetical protein